MIPICSASLAFATLVIAQDLYPVSVEKERAIVQQLQASLDTRYRYSQDAAVVAYVNRLGVNIASHSVYHILATTDVFATAFPQGHVYVTNGLLARVENEAELAGVLAHEAAHSSLALEWHTAQIPLAVFGKEGGVCLRFGPSSPVLISQQRESRADLDAAPLLRKAGYSPIAMLDFFEQLLPSAGDLSSERFALAASAPAESVVTTSAFEAMQSRLRRPVPHL